MMRVLQLVFLLFCMQFSVSAQGLADTLAVPVEIRTTRGYENGVVSLSRSNFLSMPASFDDPSRLLLKYPGISTANDQANSVIYHGLPSHFHQWQLYGARILNPNHLSNAGTLSDNSSTSSGGVNMMSGQVIGEMSFYGNPSAKSLNSIAGNSDVKLRDPYQNNVNLNVSLIGMEAGIDRMMGKQKNQSLMLNYRYSTVGLLTDFGLDFGGEVIKYQDATAKYSIKTKKVGNFNFYAVYGKSTNDKAAVSPVTEMKDSLEVGYLKDTEIYGISHSIKLKDSMTWSSTINHSLLLESRSANTPYSLFETKTDQRASSEIQERLTSFSSQLSKLYSSGKLTAGISVNQLRSYVSNAIRVGPDDQHPVGATVLSSAYYSKNRTETLGTVSYESHLGGINYRLNAGALYSTVNRWYPTGAVSFSTANGFGAMQFSYALAAQEPSPYISNLYRISEERSRHTQSHSLKLQQSYKAFSVSLFYHRLFNIVYADVGGIVSSLDEVGMVLNKDFELYYSTADIYGIDLNYNTTIAGIDLFSTLTLMNGSQRIEEKSVNIPYNYGHIANLRMSKKWKLTKSGFLGLGVSVHHRGGAFQSKVDTENSIDIGHTAYLPENPYSVRLKNYWRVDMRLYYAVQRGSYKSTVSLDIQNVTNRLNDAFYYYEALDGAARLRQQLGLLPVLSWRVSF